MIVLEVRAEDPAEVPLVQDDDVVDAFAADAADHPLDVRRLPRAPRCREHFLYLHRLDSPTKRGAVHAVAVVQEIARCGLPRKRLDDLLSGPVGSRMHGNAEVSHTAAVVLEDDEDVQDLEADRGDGEEVDRDEVLGVIGEKSPPGRGWWLESANAVFLHGRLRNVDAELAKLTHDARRTPRRVGVRHLADQLSDLLRDGWSAGPSPAAQSRPMVSETSALPGDHCPWLHEDESLSPTGPRSGEPRPKGDDRLGEAAACAQPFCKPRAGAEERELRCAAPGETGTRR